ncbi:MAG: sigma-54-dependent Fis family transcriptional regulator [candidate division Zixibacteria bacterium]|nr:sigma-54-dependent Fis family transcriptional regulator [candidate division Zixibacteria bacterium]
MKILLADDDRSLRRVLQFKLEQNGYQVTAVKDGASALDALRTNKFDLLLSDIKMPGMDGLELLERAKSQQPGLKVILITAYAAVNQAVQAVKLGAFDYITKPFEDEELLMTIEKALEFKKLESENIKLRKKLQQESKAPKLIGVSQAFKKMLSIIDKIAETDATVLITGESGTGKELVAKTLHYKSGRSTADFIAINCAAIPKDLLESELFGHIRGSFTGAVKDKNGKFELANGGTLFLDEVGEMAGDLQAKLLRALQERVIEPIGAERPVEVDLRIIAATNANLQERVLDGSFREDLFYRLNVIPVRIPSLLERKEDIPLLVQEFIRKSSPKIEIIVSPKLMDKLLKYSWPGNVRELENLVERMIVLRRGKTLTPKDLPEDFGTFDPRRDMAVQKDVPEHVTFREAEVSLVRDALERCGWNRTKAAKYLNVPRHVLIYRMKKHSIEEPESSGD